MKHIFCVMCFVCCVTTVAGQCPEQNMTFTTQSDLDSFLIDYPNCKRFSRNITLRGDDIVSLMPLSNLTHIRELNIIDCNSLVSYRGLDNLVSIFSSLNIKAQRFGDFNPFNNLITVGNLSLELLDIDTIVGFSKLEDVNKLELRVVGRLYNNAFSDLSTIDDFYVTATNCDFFGFTRLKRVGYFRTAGSGISSFNTLPFDFQVDILFFTNVKSLENLNFLINVKSVNSIQITGPNSICDISGLGSLEDARLISFSQMPMKDLSDFESLKSVDQLRFYDCDSLTSLHGLHDSLSINKNFEIALCSNLKDASGVPAAVGDRINELILRQNDSLEICNADWICRHIESGKETTLFDNAPGCNDPDSILAQCTFTTTIDELSQNNTLYPNPAYDIVCINHVNHASNRFSYEITDINGYKETYSLDNNCISVDHLAAGFYILHIIHGGHYIESLKFIKL